MAEYVQVNIRSAFVSFFNITNYIKAVLKTILQQIFQFMFFHVYFLSITFSCNYWELWHLLYIFKRIFLSILDICIYSYAIINFHALDRYLLFCKKVLSFFYKKGLRPLRQALVHYCEKIKQKSGLRLLNEVLGYSRKKILSTRQWYYGVPIAHWRWIDVLTL